MSELGAKRNSLAITRIKPSLPLSLVIAKYYVFFLCLNIFLPKVNFGFGSFYVFDFVNLFVLIMLLGVGRVFRHLTIQTYIIFIVISAISFFAGLIHYEAFDYSSFARLIKFIFFILYLIVPYFIMKHVSAEDVMKVVKWQYVFILIAGLWVLYNMLSRPLPLYRYIWEYSNQYRLVGLTGYALDLSGKISMDGTTSVSMGVFVALIFFIFLSLYKFKKQKKHLILALSLIPLELLTYSRAGILVMATGVLYYLILNLRPEMLMRLFLLICVVPVAAYLGAFDRLTAFGGLAKIFSVKSGEDGSVNTRIDMLMSAYEYMGNNPETLLWGTGYGEIYTHLSIGYPHLEGLLPTTLFTTGFIAVIFLCLHFYSLWHTSKLYSVRIVSDFSIFLYAFRLFVPGWFLSAVVAGNTFQTDFYFPFIYFLFFISYLHLRFGKNVYRP